MKKMYLFAMITLWLLAFCPCRGQSEVVVKYGQKYVCGDSFELTLPDQPTTTTTISRNFFSYITITNEAQTGETFLTLRVKLRNLTPLVYEGLKPESFQLTGYVRDRKQVYLPEMMQPYDYSSAETYTFVSYDDLSVEKQGEYMLQYNKYALLLPLRQTDILLVYRVNPILINWDLTVNLQATNGTSGQYGELTYDPIPDQDPCNVVLLFPSIMDGKTRQPIEYERPE